MAKNSISNIVYEAARVVLANTVRIYGINTYSIASDFIAWDGDNTYSLMDIARSFGSRKPNSSVEIAGGKTEVGFCCGDSAICAYDFGLLYSVFTAMVMAKVELGDSFYTHSEKLSRAGLYIVWIGNDAVLYSVVDNIILPLKNADVENACSGDRLSINNFCGRNSYYFEREGTSFVFTSLAGELLCTCKIPQYVMKCYSRYFAESSVAIVNNEFTSWDEGSQLGMLIGATDSKAECLEVLQNYKSLPVIESVVSRKDLVVELQEKYSDLSNFFGSICYTDKGEIVIAINFRRGLFVYRPWFVADGGDESGNKIDTAANFKEFYNVTQGCNHILRFASTVTNRPLSAAQLDKVVIDQIKDKFLGMSLPRIPIEATFGRIVIPEDVLVGELTNGTGETLFCVVPVGIVGEKLACLTPEGTLSAIKPSGWALDSAFYDITEVAQDVRL